MCPSSKHIGDKAVVALGLDVGTQKTGMALYKNGVVHILTTIVGKQVLPAIIKAIHDHNVNVVVLGVPPYGDMRSKILQLHKDLVNRFPNINIILVNEDKTSKIARFEVSAEYAVSSGVNRSKFLRQAKRRGKLDSRAAAFILKMGLDKLGVEYEI